LHHNVPAIARANKLARIAWAVLNKGRAFECVKPAETASELPDPRAVLGAVLAAAEQDARTARRPALTAPCARRVCARRPGQRNDRQARTKEQREVRRDR
jgi:hypothetical protein